MHKNNYCTNFTFDDQGRYLASCTKGTILKLLDLKTNNKSYIFMNMTVTPIETIQFTSDNKFILVTEPKGIIKFFKFSGEINENKE